VGGARCQNNNFCEEFTTGQSEEGPDPEHKRARNLFVHKFPGTLISTFSELPAFT
jgi:hypothetical protein